MRKELEKFIKTTKALALDQRGNFTYKSGADVLATFKKYGWTPPSEVRKDFNFGKDKG